MIVCICKAVCDRTIRATIAGGACTVEAVSKACRAGTSCGSCLEQIQGMLPKKEGQAQDVSCPSI